MSQTRVGSVRARYTGGRKLSEFKMPLAPDHHHPFLIARTWLPLPSVLSRGLRSRSRRLFRPHPTVPSTATRYLPLPQIPRLRRDHPRVVHLGYYCTGRVSSFLGQTMFCGLSSPPDVAHTVSLRTCGTFFFLLFSLSRRHLQSHIPFKFVTGVAWCKKLKCAPLLSSGGRGVRLQQHYERAGGVYIGEERTCIQSRVVCS
ncbi:hypothetical protein B0H13DRAFT_2658830 [Mycena leptocephala]|nr:hypothetical protein B0H13DRAFT_2658830 [Mycena leptocephala]